MDERGRPDPDDKGILDTVRRILSEDQARAPEATEARHGLRSAETDPEDDVLELEPTMMVETQPAGGSRPAGVPQPEPHLLGDQAQQTTRHSLGSLRTVLREQKSLLTHRNGPTIEDIIREEIRPLLREWLDQNLPTVVEQLVRTEIARIVERDGA